MSKKIMLVGVGWEQLPLAYKAREKGLFVVATTSWNGEIPADVVYHADSRDLDELERIFRIERPDAVLADECDYSMYAVAYLAEKYHLPGPSLKALTITNNKYLQRLCGTNCGILQPEYVLCWSWEQAQQFALEHSYPIVIKPVDNRGSIGVCVVYSAQELQQSWFEAVKNSHSRLVIAEEYIAGDVITVDGYCHKGGFTFLSAATRDTYSEQTTVGKALYYPGLLTKEQLSELEQRSSVIVTEAGISYGFVHIEYLKKSGEFWFQEVANRGGGIFISNTVLPYITETDLMGFYIDHALGERAILKINSSNRKAVVFSVEAKGDRSAKEVIEEQKDQLLAFHCSQFTRQRVSPIKNGASRQTIMVLKGTDFEQIKVQAVAIENAIGYAQEEDTYFNRYSK